MKRLLGLTLILSLSLSCATMPLDEKNTTPAPYEENEFSPALKKVRRAEILLLGSLPLFYMFTSMGYDLFVSDPPDSQTQLAQKFTISLSLSGLLSITDFIMGEFQNEGNKLND